MNETPDTAAHTTLQITSSDRELFIFLLGFDAVDDETKFHRIRAGEFDHWAKMKAIATHRVDAVRAALSQAGGASD